MHTPSPTQNLIEHAKKLSRYVRGLIDSGACSPDAAQLQSPFTQSAMREALAVDAGDEEGFLQKLRKLRQNTMLRIISRDLGQLADLAKWSRP